MSQTPSQIELEAAVYRRLRDHLQGRPDVQNIDLMNLAGFCRNCLSNWYREASETAGVAMTKDKSREIVYGMPYDEWRKQHQREVPGDALEAFARNRPADETSEQT